MKASQRIRIEGHVSAGFEAVREAFAENFSRRGELGGACYVYFREREAAESVAWDYAVRGHKQLYYVENAL